MAESNLQTLVLIYKLKHHTNTKLSQYVNYLNIINVSR